MSGSKDLDVLRAEAEERMVDAAIYEVVAEQDESSVPVAASGGGSGPTRSTHRTPWLAAAGLLLGCAVVVSLSVMTTTPGVDEADHQGLELPPVVKVVGADELAKVDAKTENLELAVASPEHLAGLVRLTQLRALAIGMIEEASADIESDQQAWRDAGPGALAVLARCRRLQRVQVGHLPGMDPRACDVLQHLPALREIELIGVSQLVDRELVAGWSKLELRRVQIHFGRVSPGGFAALCELPRLIELELENALHLDRCDLAALGRLRELRKLTLGGVGSRFSHSLSRSHPLPAEQPHPLPEEGPAAMHTGLQMPGELRLLLDARAMSAVASLPRLEELQLPGSVVDDAVLAAVPDGLRSLNLVDVPVQVETGGIGVTAAGVRGLGRLTELEILAWSDMDVIGATATSRMPTPREKVAAAWREVLPKFRLREATLHGCIRRDSLGSVLQEQRQLQKFEFSSRHISWSAIASQPVTADLGFVASLPQLRELTLTNLTMPFAAGPLAQAPALQRVAVFNATGQVKAEIQRVLGERDVEVTYH